MSPMLLNEPAERMFLLSMKLTGFSFMRVSSFRFGNLQQGSKIRIQMRGNSLNVFTGYLGGFAKAETVSLRAGI